MILAKCLKAKEVANILNVSISMVYKLVDSGEIAFRKFGTAIRFIESDINEYIENSKIVSSTSNSISFRKRIN